RADLSAGSHPPLQPAPLPDGCWPGVAGGRRPAGAGRIRQISCHSPRCRGPGRRYRIRPGREEPSGQAAAATQKELIMAKQNPAYDLTDAEKRDLTQLIQAGKPLPEKYRFVLFEDKREVEL